jgi:hypothetical protein
MGNLQIKDETAQGVAKGRHFEAVHRPEKRLYSDPLDFAMYHGSFSERWLGPGATAIDTLYRWFSFTGLQEHINVRTKWLDEMMIEECKRINQLRNSWSGVRHWRISTRFS